MPSECRNLHTEETEQCSLNAVQANLNALHEELRKAEVAWVKKKSTLEGQIRDLEALKRAGLNGVDTGRLMRGKAVVACRAVPYYVERWANGPKQCDKETREEALKSAIERIPNNYLDSSWVVVKQYAHFDEQREDTARGRHPRHGSIRMLIGSNLQRSMTDAEKSDAIYYLSMILAGKIEWDAWYD
jgi:hypothetical protein